MISDDLELARSTDDARGARADRVVLVVAWLLVAGSLVAKSIPVGYATVFWFLMGLPVLLWGLVVAHLGFGRRRPSRRSLNRALVLLWTASVAVLALLSGNLTADEDARPVVAMWFGVPARQEWFESLAAPVAQGAFWVGITAFVLHSLLVGLAPVAPRHKRARGYQRPAGPAVDPG